MNQRVDKPISEFTDKQRQTYKITLKALTRGSKSKRQLYTIITNERIYKTKRDRKETLKMLIRNPKTRISSKSDGRVVNEMKASKHEP
jgi:hypothetical protein